MNSLLPSVMNYNDNEIRLIGTFANPWICANDICKILNYKHRSSITAISKHVDPEDKCLGSQLMDIYSDANMNKLLGRSYFINESGLMNLICSCKLTDAKDFKRFVMVELQKMRSNICSIEAVSEFKKTLPALTEYTNDEMEKKYQEERQLRIAAEAKADEERLLKEEERRLKEEERLLKEEERRLKDVALKDASIQSYDAQYQYQQNYNLQEKLKEVKNQLAEKEQIINKEEIKPNVHRKTEAELNEIEAQRKRDRKIKIKERIKTAKKNLTVARSELGKYNSKFERYRLKTYSQIELDYYGLSEARSVAQDNLKAAIDNNEPKKKIKELEKILNRRKRYEIKKELQFNKVSHVYNDMKRKLGQFDDTVERCDKIYRKTLERLDYNDEYHNLSMSEYDSDRDKYSDDDDISSSSESSDDEDDNDDNDDNNDDSKDDYKDDN